MLERFKTFGTQYVHILYCETEILTFAKYVPTWTKMRAGLS